MDIWNHTKYSQLKLTTAHWLSTEVYLSFVLGNASNEKWFSNGKRNDLSGEPESQQHCKTLYQTVLPRITKEEEACPYSVTHCIVLYWIGVSGKCNVDVKAGKRHFLLLKQMVSSYEEARIIEEIYCSARKAVARFGMTCCWCEEFRTHFWT